MATDIEVLFTPADFDQLKHRNLQETVCVVFDILRATTSMITALANGARAVIPVAEISEAVALHKANPSLLLAGERHGVRIRKHLTGGPDFDFGNSPREFTADKVAGKTLVSTTTNGTRALRACHGAREILASSFLNLGAIVGHLQRIQPKELIVVCSGTFEQAAYEDILAAGALLERLQGLMPGGKISDAAIISRQIYQLASANLMAAMQHARNGRTLLANPELREDVAFSVRMDVYDFVAALDAQGTLRVSCA